MRPRLALHGVLATLLLGAGSATAAPAPAHARAAAAPAAAVCRSGYYENVDGVCVQRPGPSASGATARCRDGAYSYSRHASGTCSGHGGVAVWIHHP